MGCCGRNSHNKAQPPVTIRPINAHPQQKPIDRVSTPPIQAPIKAATQQSPIEAASDPNHCEFRHHRPNFDTRFRIPVFYCSKYGLLVNENHCKKCIASGKHKAPPPK